MIRKSTFSVTDTAVLAAFCMFLSLIEYMIPKPLPFMRIGLAHLPVLISLVIFPIRGTLLLTLLKILGQGLVNGSLFSYIFLFSAAGSLTSTIVMIAVYRLLNDKRVSLTGVSVAGAFASNIIQIILARKFIFGEAAVLIAPPFLAVGILSSFLLGLFAQRFCSESVWINDRDNLQQTGPGESNIKTEQTVQNGFAGFAFIFGLLAVPAFVFQQDEVLRIAATAVFIVLSVVSGKRFRLLPNLLMAAGIIAANLFTPFGRVLVSAGPFLITEGALHTGIDKATLIIGLIYISRSSVRGGLKFPGKIGSILSLVFYYFEKLTEGEKIGRKNIISQLDLRLASLNKYESGDIGDNHKTMQKKYGPLSYITAALPFIAAWGLFAVSLI